MYHIMIIDDHPIVREGLAMILKSTTDIEVVAVSANGSEALKKLNQLRSHLDLILIDLLMPKMDGLTLIKKLNRRYQLLILSTELNIPIARHLLDLGVRGYLLKEEAPQRIVSEITHILQDDTYVALSNPVTVALMKSQSQHRHPGELTDKQLNILSLIAKGQTNREIAKHYLVTERTIKNYVTEIYEILDVTNRPQAISVAINKGLISS